MSEWVTGLRGYGGSRGSGVTEVPGVPQVPGVSGSSVGSVCVFPRQRTRELENPGSPGGNTHTTEQVRARQ